MKALIAIIIIILAGWGIYAMVGKDEVETPADTNTTVNTGGTASTTQGSTDTTPSQSVKTFTVNGSNFTFAPASMTVNKGDRVRIVFNNVGGNHDLVIDEFNARTKVIGNGQSETIEFTADKTGSFEYYCSVGTHRQMGMKGTLIVK